MSKLEPNSTRDPMWQVQTCHTLVRLAAVSKQKNESADIGTIGADTLVTLGHHHQLQDIVGDLVFNLLL